MPRTPTTALLPTANCKAILANGTPMVIECFNGPIGFTYQAGTG